MSWEIMRSETSPCKCGEGTATVTFEMDDWNRTRSSTEIQCSICRGEQQRKWDAGQARENRRDQLLKETKQLATDRYLSKWLALFADMSKKAAWQRYMGGIGYPALATFYQHAKHHGSLNKYLEWCLTNDLDRALQVLAVEDKEIEALLKEREQLWRPTSGSLM